MAYSNIEQTVLDITTPIAEENGVSIWDIEYKKEGKENVLRVYIDKEGGASIGDCEAVSTALSARLDEVDPIPGAYMLEVTTAGLDRKLKRESDFLRYLGHEVDVKLYAPLDGLKEFTATLKDFKDETMYLEYENNSLSVPLSKAASVRLAVIF